MTTTSIPVLDTPITTAARKIARDLNATPTQLVSYYTADGTRIDTHEADMQYARPEDRPQGWAIKCQGQRRRHITYREVQYLLDDYNDAIAHGCATRDEIEWHLRTRDAERESAIERQREWDRL